MIDLSLTDIRTPRRLWSGDDFYVLSSQLAVIETTSSVFDNSLWRFYTNESVYTWCVVKALLSLAAHLSLRVNVMVANRLAVSAFNWTNIFALYSSGTYTNQWLIVDFNLYKSGDKLQAQTVMVLEVLILLFPSRCFIWRK